MGAWACGAPSLAACAGQEQPPPSIASAPKPAPSAAPASTGNAATPPPSSDGTYPSIAAFQAAIEKKNADAEYARTHPDCTGFETQGECEDHIESFKNINGGFCVDAQDSLDPLKLPFAAAAGFRSLWAVNNLDAPSKLVIELTSGKVVVTEEGWGDSCAKQGCAPTSSVMPTKAYVENGHLVVMLEGELSYTPHCVSDALSDIDQNDPTYLSLEKRRVLWFDAKGAKRGSKEIGERGIYRTRRGWRDDLDGEAKRMALGTANEKAPWEDYVSRFAITPAGELEILERVAPKDPPMKTTKPTTR